MNKIISQSDANGITNDARVDVAEIAQKIVANNNVFKKSLGASPSRDAPSPPPRKTDGKRKRQASSAYSLSQIAIKRKDNSSLNTNTEVTVVLLNGNWDTSCKIPNIVAEMHNVDLEELQPMKCATSCKQMKIEATTSPCMSSGISSMSMSIETPSPMGSDSGIEGDSDGNLSWLLNYKINELPPVPEPQTQYPIPEPVVKHQEQRIQHESVLTLHPNVAYHAIDEHGNVIELPKAAKTYSIPAIPEVPQRERFYMPSNSSSSGKCTGPKKPPFTYTELIEHALIEKGELTVSGIYQWISDHFPFYKQNDDRWKNSVRHNLSINPHFRKGSKAVHGAGHLWTIAQKEDFKAWQIKRQRMQQFINSATNDYAPAKIQDIELANATASIMPPETECKGQTTKRSQPQNVAVEYVIDVPGGLGDFLCPPVSKEQVVEECGLDGGDYFITDLNPAALGLNITEAEYLNGSHLYDDLNFQGYELQGE